MSRCPIFPKPSEKRASLFKIFFKKSRSWMDALYARSYIMKMGEIRFPTSKLFMVNDLSQVKKMMIEKPENYPKHHVLYEVLEPLLGGNLFTSNGQEWSRQRDVLMPGFKQNNVNKVFEKMVEATNSMQQRLAQYEENKAFDIASEMTLVTADIIFRAILSSNINEEEAKQVMHAFSDFQKQSPKITILRMFGIPKNRLFDFYDRKRIENAKKVRKVIEKVVQERMLSFENGDEKDDILHAVLVTASQLEHDFSVKEISDQMVTLFLGGHETSAAALTWTIYLISLFPEEQEKLFDEINSVNPLQVLTSNDVKQFKLLKQVFMESLRLYPPVGFLAREATENQEMRGKKITTKDAIVIAPWLIQRNENYWDKPHEFCPHRFDNGDPSERGAYIPFGMGSRVCIGMSFAIQEAMLVLSTLIREYRFELEEGFEPKPVGSLTIRSENGMRVKKYKR
ncbi:cytochrome P450 [Thiomicrorhabdus immobilis]|uniref:Cytochrome P450 n=1 Tax=Thiomicrorhabdus immobilis TaxID=2791037 RepID=A0ABN6CXW5_9GAMM|nr:cytochrome P450 [Thiomicrorhabdus immobilis]BCN92730.1 cytochrome P450 [Thiomicrorhabdus immobilis]